MRIYFDSYGSVYSLNKKDAIKVLKDMLKNEGEYSLYRPSMRIIKAKVDEYEMFRQGNKLKAIFLNVVSASDDWEYCGKDKVKWLLEEISK